MDHRNNVIEKIKKYTFYKPSSSFLWSSSLEIGFDIELFVHYWITILLALDLHYFSSYVFLILHIELLFGGIPNWVNFHSHVQMSYLYFNISIPLGTHHQPNHFILCLIPLCF
jgi:hypothetical protein